MKMNPDLRLTVTLRLLDGEGQRRFGPGVAALLEHGGPGLVDLCLCNSDPIGRELLERYSAEDAEPMRADRRELELLGAEAVFRPLLDTDCGYARHSGVKVAQAVVELYQQRAETKIF